jgi:NAD(P)H-hydrate epimerase
MMGTNARTRTLSRDEVRSIDRTAAEAYGIPTLVLMENAGRGAAEFWRELAGLAATTRALRVTIFCGPGNNGGDGGVVARHLDAWGHHVAVVWLGDPARRTDDARVQAEIVCRSGIELVEWTERVDADDLDARLAGSDWVIDALLGTGLTRPVEGPMRSVIEAINRSSRPVLALDLPSGLNADTGEALGVAVQARATATFVGPKRGFAQPGAERFCGEVRVVEIGVPRVVLRPFLVDGEGADTDASD